MALRSWFHHHFVTHHHVLADRLVRGALIVMVVILLGGFFFLRFSSSRRGMSVQMTMPATMTVKSEQDVLVSIQNNGKQFARGVAISFLASPNLTIFSIDNNPYPPQGVVMVDSVPVGAFIRYRLRVRADAVGAASITARAHDGGSGRMVGEHTSDITVVPVTLHARVSARYYSAEGEQLGRGPLPPEVGEETMYYASIHIPLSSERWNTVEVGATLGPHVVWADFVPQDSDHIRYDKNTNRLTWRVEQWPAPDDTFPHAIGASFGIVLTPTATDIGSEPVLLTAIHARGVTVTGERVEETMAPVTTRLEGDVKAEGRGLVVP